jgi:membrane-bound inhibitor of C-type lysozyme
MGNKFVTVLLITALGVSLSACSSMSVDKVWPFGEKSPSNQPKRLANATEYLCEGGKRFHVRYADNDNTAWLIYPDREVSLAKEASATRYTNGIAVLEINGAEATLKDGPAVAYSGCKAAGK